MEVACEYDDRKIMWVSADEKKMINRMLKLKEQYPDKVEILRMPETNDGCIYAKCPAEWLSIRPPKKMNYTEEQREANAERLRKARESMKQERENDFLNQQADAMEDDETEDDNEDA